VCPLGFTVYPPFWALSIGSLGARIPPFVAFSSCFYEGVWHRRAAVNGEGVTPAFIRGVCDGDQAKADEFGNCTADGRFL
jgi:hypothetical protein